jgi:GH15 family glucan-1,4-alpha-glucosidase
MNRIEDYGFLSDMESAALVSRDGSVDWLCWPRFDSAACFCALLDDGSAGFWRIAPADQFESRRAYVGDCLVLETTFETAGGAVVLTDCLALGAPTEDARPVPYPENVYVRRIRGLRGTVALEMVYRPRLDYGSIVPWFRERHGAVEAVGGPDTLDLTASVPLDVDKDGATARFEVSEGESVSFLVSYHRSHEPGRHLDPGDAGGLIDRTADFWRLWAEQVGGEGEWRELKVRSLLTLKALTYAPSGGIVAAPTTSLPEEIGGARNWDYRYCWLRDATFTLDALVDNGFTDEARAWRDWLLRAVAGDPEDMQIMYGLLGERRLLEYTLPLKGYEGSQPVRVGNAAHEQFQLDVYGEVMDSFHSARRAGIDTPDHAWALEREIVDHVCRRWREPDDGIWEVRSGPRHFVHSKVMAWVALDRGIKAVEVFGEQGPVESWRKTREEIRAEVLGRGVDPERGCFMRSYDEPELDASLLMLPFVGFVEATDARMVATIEAIERELVVDGFVRRYDTERVDDGLPPGEATFLMCSFWLVDCLVLLGRNDDAIELFRRLVSCSNDLGLLSEQYDSARGRLVGNFPQAFSHVALLTAASALASAGATRSVNRGRP